MYRWVNNSNARVRVWHPIHPKALRLSPLIFFVSPVWIWFLLAFLAPCGDASSHSSVCPSIRFHVRTLREVGTSVATASRPTTPLNNRDTRILTSYFPLYFSITPTDADGALLHIIIRPMQGLLMCLPIRPKSVYRITICNNDVRYL